jgi:hypothetical protein
VGLTISAKLLPFRRVREIAKSDHQFLHVCLSVRTEQLGSKWTEFKEILYLGIFKVPAEEIKVSIKPNKNNGYCT